jgi:RND family efflux transporter MFP subunit
MTIPPAPPEGKMPRSRDADLGALRIDRGPKPRRTRPRRLYGLAAGLVVVTGSLAFMRTAGLFPGARPLVQTTVAIRPTAGSGLGRSVLTANGYVEARHSAAVSAEVQGRLLRLHVQEGTRVRKGDLLAELMSEDLRAQVARAEADIAVRRSGLQEARAESTAAENELVRQRELLSRSLGTQSALDVAQSHRDVVVARIGSAGQQLRAAGAQLRLDQAQLSKTRIMAPFDGTVLVKNAEVGEMVAPVSLGGSGSRGAIVTIASLDSLDVQVDVNEAYIGRLRLGQPASVSVDAYPDTTFEARIRQIVPTADRQKATVQVKAEILRTTARLLPDMGAKVTFLASTDSSSGRPAVPQYVTLPDSAVQREGARTFVWLVHDDRRVERRDVKLGATRDGRLEITGGLTGGETVVLSAPRPLREGARVRLHRQ